MVRAHQEESVLLRHELVFEIFWFTQAPGWKRWRARPVGAGTWSPSSVRVFMVSPTWGAYLSYSISAELRCPYSWDWEMGILCVCVTSSNTLNFNLSPGANHMQTRASFLEFPDIPWLRPISGSDWISL